MDCWLLKVDWTALGTMLAGLSAVALAVLGALGVYSWREQLTGTRQIELAQEVLSNVYEVEAILEYIVSPFATHAELSAVNRMEGETDSEWSRRASSNVSQLRYLDHMEPFNRLRTLGFRVKATIDLDQMPGKGASSAIHKLVMLPRSIIGEQQRLYSAELALERLEGTGSRMSGLQSHIESARRHRDMCYERAWLPTGESSATTRAQELVREVEQALMPLLK